MKNVDFNFNTEQYAIYSLVLKINSQTILTVIKKTDFLILKGEWNICINLYGKNYIDDQSNIT